MASPLNFLPRLPEVLLQWWVSVSLPKMCRNKDKMVEGWFFIFFFPPIDWLHLQQPLFFFFFCHLEMSSHDALNLLTNRCIMTHPEVPERHYHSFGVWFLSTWQIQVQYSLSFSTVSVSTNPWGPMDAPYFEQLIANVACLLFGAELGSEEQVFRPVSLKAASCKAASNHMSIESTTEQLNMKLRLPINVCKPMQWCPLITVNNPFHVVALFFIFIKNIGLKNIDIGRFKQLIWSRWKYILRCRDASLY